jgi:hypothetical protein
MAGKISLNPESLVTILKKIQILEEEVFMYVSEVDKAIDNAELEGWNDKKYYEFRDSFQDTRGYFINGAKKIEDEHIPYIKRLLRVAEEYN